MKTYSGAQLLTNVQGSDWERELEKKIRRERLAGTTHFLFVQRDDAQIKFAALIPLSEIVPIWIRQRDIAQRLLDANKLGRRRSNFVVNGARPTIWLQDDRGGQDVADALWSHPGVENLAESSIQNRLADDEAADAEGNDSADFDPTDDDERRSIEHTIKERRGRKRFRQALRKRYRDKCVVTGCKVPAILEAAHIASYRRESHNRPDNGLLLRADIHTLSDLELLGIEPIEMRIEVDPKLLHDSFYAGLHGQVLNCSQNERPSTKALSERYERFRLHQ